MQLQNFSRQHPEIGSVALRMLWIPVVASVVIAGYLALRTPQNEPASVMAVAITKEMPMRTPSASSDDATARTVMAAPDLPDESIVQQQTLDPVGAGHDVAR